MPKTLTPLLLLLTTLLWPTPSRAELKIVATIPPLHALAGAVVGDRAELRLLIDSGQSPHDFQLTPAAARSLIQADRVIWIGPQLESRLANAMTESVEPSRRLTVARLPGIKTLQARATSNKHRHDHDTPADLDPHLWLNADNAVVIVKHIAQAAVELDPDNAGAYRRNAGRAIERIRAADQQIAARFQTIKLGRYRVLHDSLQYFEDHYGLAPAGSLMVDPARKPGARRMLSLRRQIRQNEIDCIFFEPRYGKRWLDVLTEGTDVKTIAVDPLGLEMVDHDTAVYARFLQNLAARFLQCRRSPE